MRGLWIGCLIAGLNGLTWDSTIAGDIERALQYPQRTAGGIYRDRIEPHWLPEQNACWYRVQTGAETFEFVLVDLTSGHKKVAPSLQELGLPEPEPIRTSQATLRRRRSARTGEETSLKFVNETAGPVQLFWLNLEGGRQSYGTIAPGNEHSQHTYAGHVWLITTESGDRLAVVEAQELPQTILIDGPSSQNPDRINSVPGTTSPDGLWSVRIESGRLIFRDVSLSTDELLSTPFDERSPFVGPVHWAPDSSAFVVCNSPAVPTRSVTIVESTPGDQLQPRLREFSYAKPGDELPRPVPVLCRVNAVSVEVIPPHNELFAQPFTESPVFDIRWAPDSREFYFDYNARGHQTYRIVGVDKGTGAVRAVVEETSPTFIDYTNKTRRHWLDASGELLWMSERTGWCHLWLVNIASGKTAPVTTGDWVVRDVLHVDDAQRQIWFLASGLRAEEDPYHEHLCRVNFDGTGFQRLTEGNGQHQVTFSPQRDYFVDQWSRADLPPVHELRRSSDGSLVALLETAVIDELLATGWTLPERFVAPGRDGQTAIHGVIIKPSDFDPDHSYPIVEEVYAGPHSAFAPKGFGRLQRQHQIAELGFIVVQSDGMGTNHRGKAFHDVCWKNLKDAGFPDRIAWIKGAAQTRPWMDLSRVGIYGGSAGGQSAMRALLDHADFYMVAVADCGCHDNRMDKIWWNEQWLGWPIDESYPKNSNAADAHKLQGALLLIVGELDQNVDPASTSQVVSALQRAGKPFRYMPIMGAGHGAAETPYGFRLRMEFLNDNLLSPQD